MAQKAAGRKPTYTDNDLKAIVKQYCMENIGQKVTVTKLISYSGISKATWYRSEAAQKYIQDMNYAPLLVATKDVAIPTLNEIQKTCGNDVAKYKEVIRTLLDIIEKQGEEIDSYKKMDRGIDSNITEKLKNEMLEKDRTIKRLNEKINMITASNDKLINLKDNMDKTNKNTFLTQFKELFEDD